MKRYNNLFDKIVDFDNLVLADSRARHDKSHRKEIVDFDKDRIHLLLKLLRLLIDETYVTSEYHTFTIYEPKERKIFKLPYYPDRIVHHAIMNILEPIWVKLFIPTTYNCIKKRGIHKALSKIKQDMLDKEGTKYCLKLDIKKFYPSLDHDILKRIIRIKIKDEKLLRLLDGIIDSASGVPIGNYLSLFFANLYLNYFDHWIKEVKRMKYYYRYADDIVILHSNKDKLRLLLHDINEYLNCRLNLLLKHNYLIFPVDSRSVDFVGYRIYHDHTLIRKNIKKSFCRKNARLKKREVDYEFYRRKITSYIGWFKHANCFNLLSKTLVYKELLVYLDMKVGNRTTR